MDNQDFVNIDFDAVARHVDELQRHIDASTTSHEAHCRFIEQRIGDHLARVPSVQQPLLDLVALMRHRHTQSADTLRERWLPTLTDFVAEVAQSQAQVVKETR